MGEPIVLDAGRERVNAVVFACGGDYLIAACSDASVRVWRTSDWREEGSMAGHTKSVNSLDVSPDGALLATVSSGRNLRMWTLPQGVARAHRSIGKDRLTCVHFAPGGETILTGGSDGALRLWGLPELDERAEFRGPEGSILGLGDFSPDGEWLVGAGDAPEIHLWRLPAGDPVGILPGHDEACTALAFSPRGLLLASAGKDGKLRLTSEVAWKRKSELDLDARGSYPIAWRPDGDALAVGSERRVRVLSAPDLQLLGDLEVPVKGVYGLAFAPGSNAAKARLACAAADGRVCVWDLA